MLTCGFKSDLPPISLYTHAGVFHADEVFATEMFIRLFARKREVQVNRVFQVPAEIDSSDDRVFIYDIGHGELDHHQKGGNGTRDNGVPYASAGLVWKKIGLDICGDPRIVADVDEHLIQAIDAHDNGYADQKSFVDSYDPIGAFNPTWDSDEDPEDAFDKALVMAGKILDNAITKAKSKVAAEELWKKVSETIGEERYVVLPQFFPWQSYLLGDERAKDLLYVIFPSNRGGYNVQAIPLEEEGFANRKPLPESWRGLRDEDLQKITGIPGAIFTHPAGFIGACKTLKEAKQMVTLAINA